MFVVLPCHQRCYALLIPISLYAPLAFCESPAVLPSVIVSSDTQNADSSETLIQRQEIESTHKNDLNALLRGQNGVLLSQSNASTSTGLTVGGASGSLGLVTLDGVPIFGTVTSAYSLHHLLGEFIDRIDIQRAGSGDVSASRTLGGALHLDSRELKNSAGFAKAEAGNYGVLRASAGKGWQTPLGDWTTIVERQAITDGYTQASTANGNHESDNFQLYAGLLRGRKTFANGGADATLMYTHGREQFDGPGLLPGYRIGWVDDRALGHNQSWLAQGHVYQKLASHWQTSLQLGWSRNRQDAYTTLLPYQFIGNLWLLRWENQHDLSDVKSAPVGFKFNWGVDLQQQHGEGHSAYGDHIATLTSSSAFLQTETRVQNWLLKAETRLEDHEYYGSKALFSAKLAWDVRDDVQLWVSGGTGFNPPAVNDRLNPMFGRLDLKPESVTSAEVGGRWQPSKQTELTLNFSHRDYRQLVVLQFDSPTGISRAENVPNAEIWMLETGWKHAWNGEWQTGLNYTFMDARNTDSNLIVPIRPEHQGNLWQSWQATEQVQLRMELNVRDSFWFDRNNTQQNSPAPRLNLVANYQATPAINLYLRGENLNAEHSPEVNQFGYPGLTFWGGIKTNF